MRALLLTSVLMGINSIAFAADDNALNYNVVNVQAEASRQVSNDEMFATLFIEKSNKQPSELASQINQLINQALAISHKYPQVKVETGAQSTYPVYDNNSNKLKEWRSRAEIRLNSKDFKATSLLISELQQNFQTQTIGFSVSDSQRKKVENELMVEASKNFQQRADMIVKAWNKHSYDLINLNLNASNYAQQAISQPRAMAKFATLASAPAQDVAAGESNITVNANGSIQLK